MITYSEVSARVLNDLPTSQEIEGYRDFADYLDPQLCESTLSILHSLAEVSFQDKYRAAIIYPACAHQFIERGRPSNGFWRTHTASSQPEGTPARCVDSLRVV